MDILLIVPCHNEERGLKRMIEAMPSFHPSTRLHMVVIDNNCSDQTSRIAKEKGITVVHEPRQGKGFAMKRGFEQVTGKTDYVVMMDGDNTYDVGELHRLLEPLMNGFGEAISGSRLHGRITENSMDTFNRWGNWFLTFLARVAYRTNITDVCTGYWAWRRDAIERLRPHLTSDSFSIEMEMVAKMARLGISSYSVPVTYRQREGTSKLRPFKDGFSIITTWAKHLLWYPIEEIQNEHYKKEDTPPADSPEGAASSPRAQ